MEGQSIVWTMGVLIGFVLVLIGSADLLASSAVNIARQFRLTNFTIGFLLLGIVTSTPELFVGIQSLADGIPQLSVGNLIGGSILLLSVVMGLSSVIMGSITIDHGLALHEIVLSSFVIASPTFVLWDGDMSRIDGIFLVGMYVLHVIILNREHPIAGKKRKNIRSLMHNVLLIAIGSFAMAFSARMIVEKAQILSTVFHIQPLVFGLILLSLGTNLPEMALAIQASFQKKRTLAFADFLGSSAVNTLFLGGIGIAKPFRVLSQDSLVVSLIILLLIVVYFVWAISTRRNITRKEGIGLLFFYGIFLLYELSNHE